MVRSVLPGFLVLTLGLAVGQCNEASVYPVRLSDPKAVYLTPDRFPVKADGKADDSEALQHAIDQVGADRSGGVLFVPSGSYRLGKTVFIWPGVRLIGYGESRPIFLLGENTPGFQDGGGKYMLFFSGGRGRGGNARPRDGNPGTFYSAIANINIEIREGNPAAVGIRFHVAQHCFLSHMEFRLGSARAGVEDIGNEVDDLHFHGGRYGILTGSSAPGWPILVIDCTFQGQSVAAVGCHNAGLTLVRPHFTNLPTAVSTTPGQPNQLWVSDALLENIDGPAFVISHEHNARTQVNFENLICQGVPTLAQFRESGEVIKGLKPGYIVDRLAHGLDLGDMGMLRKVDTTTAMRPLTSPPAPVPSDIPPLPPLESWVNVQTLGVAGDGETDDTAALRNAIATHRTLYLPLGLYRITDTLKLRPDTVLVGFNPSGTVIYLPDNTPAFQDAGSPKPVVEAPHGGSNLVSGVGIYASALNPAAVAVKWMAGDSSLMNDVRLHGGHGTRLPGGIGDSWGRAHRDHWDSQPASLWITAGGGGVFKDIWTPSPYARAGVMVSDTSTRGRIYAMSVEHHVSNEMILRNASNWRFYALQFEEEREEGPKALPLEIESCHDLEFADLFSYRVVSCFVPYPNAMRVQQSRDIRFRNVHVYSNSKVSFDNSVFDANTGVALRDCEFAVLNVSKEPTTGRGNTQSSIVAPGAKVEKLADGFLNISGLTVDAHGDVYFADPRKLQVYRWSVTQRQVEPVCKVTERPEQLAFDQSGNLLIVAYDGNGTVLALNPKEPDGEPTKLEVQPAKPRPGSVPVLPVNRWMDTGQFLSDSMMRKPYHFVSPDGTRFIPVGTGFTTGALNWGVKLADVLRAFALAPAEKGKRFYVSNESELQTWSFQVGADGTLSDPKLFVEEGGEGVSVDASGRVYIAAGQVRVFNPEGDLIDVIEVAQRPTGLVFGGQDRKTLFLTARSSLYSVRVR